MSVVSAPHEGQVLSAFGKTLVRQCGHSMIGMIGHSTLNVTDEAAEALIHDGRPTSGVAELHGPFRSP
jgi:hypothetical protein